MHSGSPIHNNEIAFLIEGHANSPTYPEVLEAQTFAASIGCQVFDPIHSYDTFHLAEYFFRNIRDQDKLKLIASQIFTNHSTEDKLFNKKLIQTLILAPFKQLVQEQRISELPPFLKKFQNATAYTPIMDKLIDEVIAKYKNQMSDEELDKLRLSIVNEITTVSNEISQPFLINYLHDNPQIKLVYGLIGAEHLPLLEKAGETTIISEIVIDTKGNEYYREGHYHVKLNIENRLVDVHLFGGKHGEPHAFLNMKKHIQLNVKEITYPLSSADHSTFYGSSTGSGDNQSAKKPAENVNNTPQKKN